MGRRAVGGEVGKKKKNEAMTGYILIVTYLPLYRLLGALLYPTYPITTQSFPRQEKKNMLAQAIYFYVWEVIIIVGLP